MKIEFSKLSDKSLVVAKSISKKNGMIYKTKPKKATGYEKYIWRMVKFMLSTSGHNMCIPVMADFDLLDHIEETENVFKHKDKDKGDTAFDFLRNNPGYKEEINNIIDDIINAVEGNKEMFKNNPWYKALS